MAPAGRVLRPAPHARRPRLAHQAELLAELVEEGGALLGVLRRRREHPLEELRRAQRRRHLPAGARRAVGAHLVRRSGGHLEDGAALVRALLIADHRFHPSLEHLEALGLARVQVNRWHPTLAGVARLHLETFRRDRDEAEHHSARSRQLLTLFSHCPLYYPAAWPSARTSSSPTR